MAWPAIALAVDGDHPPAKFFFVSTAKPDFLAARSADFLALEPVVFGVLAAFFLFVPRGALPLEPIPKLLRTGLLFFGAMG